MSSLTQSALIKQLTGLTRAVQTRHNVVNPALCDDILKRLAPSLEKYKGCLLIDEFPGVGLFSRKLHDLIQPSCHVLFEPNPEAYASFLQPLLSSPNSRYRLESDRDFRHWDTETFVSAGYIPAVAKDNGATLRIVNATESKLHSRVALRAGVADLFALVYARGAQSRSSFHARGPARMLMWCDDAGKSAFVPRTVGHRFKLAVLLEAYCHVQEVVGFDSARNGGKRESRLDVLSYQRALRRMHEMNIEPIQGREPAPLVEDSQAFGTDRPWHEDLQNLERRSASGRIPRYTPEPGSSKDYVNKEYKRLAVLRDRARTGSKRHRMLQELVGEQMDLDTLDRQIYSMDLTEDARKELLTRYEERSTLLREKVADLGQNPGISYRYLLDDETIFNMDPPLLNWDNRTYEPLQAHRNDFYKSAKVSLLDFTTKDHNAYPVTSDQAMYMDAIMSMLFRRGRAKHMHHIENLAPNAYKALVPKVTEIADIRHGGRRDVENVRIRAMTPQMFWRLAIEWDQWLFKPSLRETLYSQHSESEMM